MRGILKAFSLLLIKFLYVLIPVIEAIIYLDAMSATTFLNDGGCHFPKCIAVTIPTHPILNALRNYYTK